MTVAAGSALGGVCVEPECPVNAGQDTCRLGNPVLHCPRFQPSARSAVPAASEATSAAAAEPDTSEAPADTAAAGATSQPAPEEGSALAEQSVASETRESAEERRLSNVPKPTGPRRRVELAEDSGITLPLGFPLDAAEASLLMRAEPTRSVAVIGSPDCGKTTLLAVLFELFCRGQVGRWRFAGSNTLNALLRRCWYARLASGQTHPDTPRTAYGVTRPFVHLRVADADATVSLLFADLSGEYFENVGSGADLDEAAPVVKGAQVVVHLLDGQHWKDRRDYERAGSLARGRIRRLVERDAFHSDAQHVVGLARFDLCPPEAREAMRACASQLAARWLNHAPVVELVAHGQDDGPPEGLEELLDLVLADRPAASAAAPEESLRDTIGLVAQAAGGASTGDST